MTSPGGIDTLEAALPAGAGSYPALTPRLGVVFTIPHGPVRSGVVESVEYLVETLGEAIPHLNMRVFYKHRGIENLDPGMTAAEGVLLAERTEGIASVAHALAYCHAIERIADGQPLRAAGLVRVLYAELERVAAPGQPHLEYSSDVIEVVGTYLYQPGRRLFDVAVRSRQAAAVRAPGRLPALHAHRADRHHRGGHRPGLTVALNRS